MTNSYQLIDSFFDCYGLVHARSIVKHLVKTADSGKTWSRSAPCDVVFFSEKLNMLFEAVFDIVTEFDQRSEIILNKETSSDCWLLTSYETYCGAHINDTPWDFFPRHLNKKEFINPYRALEKFTRYRSLGQWRTVLKDLVYYALSNSQLNEFDDRKSILSAYVQLNKLIDAAHLVVVRYQPVPPAPRRKWQNRQPSEAKPEPETNNQ